MSQTASRQFSVIQLMVLLITLGLAAALFKAGANHGNQWEAISVCSSHLRGMGHAMYMYAQDGDVFPALTTSARAGEMVLFQHRTSLPLTGSIPSPTADLWVLARATNEVPNQFTCPATTDIPDPAQDTTVYYDFAAPTNLSYAYIYQYHPGRPPIGTSSNPMTPVIADANPFIKGGIALATGENPSAPDRGNSRNHRPRMGQNVLFQDSHVQFVQTPRAGLPTDPANSRDRDNLYTTTQPTGRSAPRETPPTATHVLNGGPDDACLVP
jgi:hypothetical protein